MAIETIDDLKNKIKLREDQIKLLKAKLSVTEAEILKLTDKSFNYPNNAVLQQIAAFMKVE